MTARIATALGVAAWLVSVAALAQSPAGDTAQAHFDRGAKLYNLEHFQEAIADFEEAYELDPSPIFLFNIAQSHRQLGNKERALFFYRRYLEQAPNAANREDVERRIKDLQAALQQAAELKQQRPAAAALAPEAAPAEASRPWALSVSAGPAFARLSGRAVTLPAMVAARLEGAYVFPLPAGDLEVGADLGYTRLPYTRVGTTDHPALDGTSGSSAFWGLLATVRYLSALTPALKLGGGLEGGVLFWSGLDEGNPFTLQGVAPSGAIALPSVAVNLRGEYRFTGGLFLTLTPALGWSKIPSSAGNAIAGVISSITRVDVAAGVGDRF